MDIQYFHANGNDDYQKFTVAVVVPSRDDLLDITAFGPKTIGLGVGHALCSPLDQYCKATGRQLAESRIQRYKYTLQSLTYIDEDSMLLYFYTEDAPVNSVTFKVHRKSERPHFINCYLDQY